ncbi:MAG: hypothetical protein JNL11_14765 [Bdellovibrionaceae bacterium]|nr:hypothetical protein [Pseudobdellovibrionaceae bacterium]
MVDLSTRTRPDHNLKNDPVDIKSLVRPLSLFFFFSLMNETKSIHFTIKTIEKLKKLKPGSDLNGMMIKFATELFLKNENTEVYITKNVGEFWVLPRDLELGPWKEFHKKISKKELVSLLWGLVIKIPETEILKALDVSQGTHRFRVASALKKLGSNTFLLK